MMTIKVPMEMSDQTKSEKQSAKQLRKIVREINALEGLPVDYRLARKLHDIKEEIEKLAHSARRPT